MEEISDMIDEVIVDVSISQEVELGQIATAVAQGQLSERICEIVDGPRFQMMTRRRQRWKPSRIVLGSTGRRKKWSTDGDHSVAHERVALHDRMSEEMCECV